MTRRVLASLGAIALVLAACSGGGGASQSIAACTQTTTAGTVAVEVKDFEFAPAAIPANVGDIVAFTNKGFEPHNATLDAGGCATKTLQTDQVDGLRFGAAGSYPFHCTVHPQMKGTITVS